MLGRIMSKWSYLNYVLVLKLTWLTMPHDVLMYCPSMLAAYFFKNGNEL